MNSHDSIQREDNPLGFFGRYLSLWVAACIGFGVLWGKLAPGLFANVASLEFYHVNLVVALLIWAMIYPMMVQVDFGSIREVGARPRGLVITLVINWLIKPFTMAALGWLFFEHLFSDFVPAEMGRQYIAGMILLGVAPCTAMVFVWSQLVRGDANYTLVQVSVNDLIMIGAFAPVAGLLLGVSDISVPWETLFLSVLLYVVIPLGLGYFTRRYLSRREASPEPARLSQTGTLEGRTKVEGRASRDRLASFDRKAKPLSIVGLLLTIVLLFGLQASTLLAQPAVILLIAVPLLLQSYGIFALAYGWAYLWRVPFSVAAPAALIGTSNFFELAVAVAISLFGLDSGAALATVVGVLVEVPVMLSLVAFARRTRSAFQES